MDCVVFFYLKHITVSKAEGRRGLRHCVLNDSFDGVLLANDKCFSPLGVKVFRLWINYKLVLKVITDSRYAS